MPRPFPLLIGLALCTLPLVAVLAVQTRGQGAPPTPRGPTLAIAYLAQPPATPKIQPFFDPVVTDPGLPGARLGIEDNNTTGAFTHQIFALREVRIPADGDPASTVRSLSAEGYRHILLNLPDAAIRQVANLPEARNLLLYDVNSRDDALRGEDCRPEVLHFLPSRAMRADALAQYLAKKRWQEWLLVVGPGEGDQLYGEALRRSAKKFGARIVADKRWDHRFDERRTPESEVPVLTQGDDYDVVVVADEDGLFGDLLPYRTWLARPVVGSAGLAPTAWSHTHESWGALQLQHRFKERAGRWMGETDYGAWLAVRAIGEAATRAKSIEFEAIKTYLLGDHFTLAGFKGVPLSLRAWDRQLRQPVLLTTERSLVAVAPIEGYLHPRNELDTLGMDEAESRCRLR